MLTRKATERARAAGFDGEQRSLLDAGLQAPPTKPRDDAPYDGPWLGSAELDGPYRYLLSRWEPGFEAAPFLLWGLVNPSDADALKNDPTTKSLIRLTKSFGFHRFLLVNEYALISTDPKGLRAHADPIGPLNDAQIKLAVAQGPAHTIVAWGNSARWKREPFLSRPRRMLARLGPNVECLGVNNDGTPEHPLYVETGRKLIPYPGAR